MNDLNKSRFIQLITITVILILSFFSIYTYNYNIKLKVQVKKRDIAIVDYQNTLILNRDSLRSKIVKIDTIFNSLNFTMGGKKMNPDEIIKYTNFLIVKNNRLQIRVDSLTSMLNIYKRVVDRNKIRVDSLRSTLNIYKKVIDRNGIRVDNVKYEGNIITYTTESSYRDSLKMYREAMHMYDIRCSIVKEGENTISYTVFSPKIDSALILFPYYRKYLQYNPQKKSWIIKKH